MSRLETGPHRPAPSDWQGLFVRGDDCFHYAMHLRAMLDGEPDNDISRVVVEGLASLLESTRE